MVFVNQNFKNQHYAEFGRAQAKDMLQHLWAGPTSNASVDIVQGRYYVEVHSVGVTKGSSMERILGEIVLQNKSITTPIDYVLCIGNFLGKVSFLCNQMLIIQFYFHGF
ncbi:hypothetical protein Bca4012_027354 [Brassica carinata]